MNEILLSEKKILFTGDSITEAGRRHDLASDLGWGFVQFFSDSVTIRNPDKNVSIINTGIGGNSIKHLLTRCYDDVIEHDPDIVVILIGINDVIRFMDKSSGLHANIEEFKKYYTELIGEMKKTLPNCKLFLVEPFYLSRGKHVEGSYRNVLMILLNEYIQVIRNISALYEIDVIPLNGYFNDLMKYKLSSDFSGDKVHPNRVGHFAIAELIYDSVKKEL